ncbi:hypothetical protein ACGFNU_00955 [Spirillospora sp. NPDC048911]|uniref:hypothetical protein n=1 Tax=Spirillospora sp. NPDC048911 TaxID=3364527 RepID=UPI00371C3AA9
MPTVLAAATDSGTGPGPLLLLAILAATGYMIHCLIWPYRSCRYCEGGKHRSPSGRAWRYCHRCNGKGAQLRIGRRLWTYLKNTHDRNSRHR